MAEAKQEEKYSEPNYAQPDQTSNLPWYPENIDKRLVPSTSKLLEEYSGIPPAEQSKHVHQIREKAWAVRTYPSTGLGVWLVPYIDLSPAYDRILTRLKDGETMIDVGCFVGGEFRKCVFDGAPSENMVGFDIANHWEIGYDLFQDKDKFKGRFVDADIMAVDTDKEPDELRELHGKTSIIHIAQVLHQWDWNGQLSAMKKLISFSKVGTLVVGFQIGNLVAQEIKNPHFKHTRHWRIDPDSLKKMWSIAGEQTGTTWKVEAELRSWNFGGLDDDDAAFMEPGDVPVDFVVERVR